jgi:hypothetical protein
MATIITSQHHLDDAIIAEKIAARDFEVMVSPVITVDGAEYQVILDGNHSLAAALAVGAEPEYVEASARDHDAVGLIRAGEITLFLEAVHMGEGDYLDAITRKPVW